MINLSRREKLALIAAAGFVALFIVIQFIVFPLFDKKERLQKGIVAKTNAIAEMRLLQTKYDQLKTRADQSKVRFDKRPQNFTLFSFLDKLAGQTGVKDNIAYMKPSKTAQKNSLYSISSVEMKIQAVTLNQVTRYLHKVETSPNMVTVKRLSLTKTEKKPGFVNAVLQVETLEAS
jgi:general secretion pathway protein M